MYRPVPSWLLWPQPTIPRWLWHLVHKPPLCPGSSIHSALHVPAGGPSEMTVLLPGSVRCGSGHLGVPHTLTLRASPLQHSLSPLPPKRPHLVPVYAVFPYQAGPHGWPSIEWNLSMASRPCLLQLLGGWEVGSTGREEGEPGISQVHAEVPSLEDRAEFSSWKRASPLCFWTNEPTHLSHVPQGHHLTLPSILHLISHPVSWGVFWGVPHGSPPPATSRTSVDPLASAAQGWAPSWSPATGQPPRFLPRGAPRQFSPRSK